jgi:hypothetical protein
VYLTNEIISGNSPKAIPEISDLQFKNYISNQHARIYRGKLENVLP